MSSEVIDVDELDVFCTGVRHCVRLDRTPSPRRKKRRKPVTISLLDSDSDDPLRPSISPKPKSPRPLSARDQRTELQRVTQLELNARRALHDGRPYKKRATDAMKLAMDAISNHHNELKRKGGINDVIEISSDSEPETWPSKRQKVEEPVESPYNSEPYGDPGDVPKLEADLSRTELGSSSPSDRDHSDGDDDDCIDFLASLDISNDANWIPLPERNKAEDLTPTHDSDTALSKPHPLPHFRIPREKPPVNQTLQIAWNSESPWRMLSGNYGITRFPKPFYHARRQEHISPRRPSNLHYEKGYTKLGLTAKYPHLTSGPVNKVVQEQGIVVLCASAEGGLEESDDDEDAEDQPPPPPENKQGSLVVYHRGRVHVPPAHCRPRRTSRGSVIKYYTVPDIAFNPSNPRQFLSSGCDLVVKVWEILDPDDNGERDELHVIRQIPFNSRPQDLLYSPDGLILAVTCHDGTVRLYSQDLFEDMIDANLDFKQLHAAPKGSGHAAGSTLWGKGPSKDFLFSSSEPTVNGDRIGFHRAFDIRKGQSDQFDATESGDAAAISPDGTTLALFTWGKDGTHPVYLYDVRRKQKAAHETQQLEKFQVRPRVGTDKKPSDLEEEVNHASFSPDGCLLAVARNDNALHVYDVRALSRGPLCRFEHHDSDTVGGGGYGVVAANWVQGRNWMRIGIVSGGNDGCVRLWEPSLGSTDETQGAVIGRTDFDVGHFSIGDCQNGELPLVIGDSGGGMHTYDFTNVDGIRI